jgi:integrase
MGNCTSQRLQGHHASEAEPQRDTPLNAEQTKVFIEAAWGNRLEALYVLAVTAGLRVGELLGLRWEDIDVDSGILRVRRTRSQAKSGPRFTTPKNGKGRSIRLTQRAVEALKTHKAAQDAERLKLGELWEDNGLVFCTMSGKLLDFRNVPTASFKPLLEKQYCRIYASTTSGTPALRCYSLVATIPNWCKGY